LNEIKSPTGKSKNTVGNQFIRAAKQSKCLVFDGRRTPIGDAYIKRNIELEMVKRSSIKKVVFITKFGEVVEIEPKA
jgi:hypothetical protein